MSKFVYGVDVGGTNIKFGLFLLPNMELVMKKQIKTPTKNQKYEIFSHIEATISSINRSKGIRYEDVKGIGVAIPCPVKDGVVKKCPNLDWDKMDIIKELQKVFSKRVEVFVSNDATLAAFGENTTLEIPYENAVFYTLGTGVGGGIIVNGEIIEGGTGLGGEIGHMKVFEGGGIACGCGAQGCLEQICGKSGIISYAKKLAEHEETTIDLNNINVKMIFDAAKSGDSVALKTVDRVAEHIAISASILAVVIDPNVFIIGGGVSKAGEFLIEKIVEKYQKYARFSTSKTPFISARTGNDAGFIGAAHLANNKLK